MPFFCFEKGCFFYSIFDFVFSIAFCMNPIIKFLILTFFLTQVNFAQTFDTKLISKDSEINFTETQKRGIKKNGTLYFVEKDLQTISAYKSNKMLWQTNFLNACDKPKVGEPQIRYIGFKSGKLLVVIGKHDFAEINIQNGKTELIGSD